MFKPAQKIPQRMEIHGDVRVDEYYWMRERDSAPVMDYLKQENQRTAEALSTVSRLEEKLYWEMRSRIKEDDASVPYLDEGYYYYWRFQTGQEYPLHCRKKGSLGATEEIIFDENVAAEGQSYFQVGSTQISPDQKILAYAVDTRGRRIYDIHFKDLATGQMLPDKITSVTPDFEWAADNRTVFFVRQDEETLRAYQVYRYELGGSAPELILEEKDETYSVGLSTSRTRRFLFMTIAKRDSTEVRVLESKQPRSAWRTFLPRELNHEYEMEDAGDRFFVLSNWQAQNFRVLEAPYSASEKLQWQEIIPHNPSVYIEGIHVYEKYMVLSERENGLSQLRVWMRDGTKPRLLKFPDATYEVELQALPDYHGTTLRFAYESLVQPPAVMEEDYLGQNRTVRKTREVPGYNKELYQTERLWAEAPDGTLVPVSVVQRKDRAPGGPMLLYAYGSYGLSVEDYFRGWILSLLDRGFAFAIAHIRGGSEMGRPWYENGRMFQKMNTFTDFIASAEKLIADHRTRPEHLHIMGGSAGGLLMGAVINLRPDLFKSAVAAVPFVDVLTTMLDPSIPLTTGEYNEWGDPRIKEQYLYMRKYSPYDNLEAKAYPNLLVTTGYHDSQVQYWEPAKWVAKLRELKTDHNLLLLYTELEAGHSGASGRFEALKTLAKELGFILMLEGFKD